MGYLLAIFVFNLDFVAPGIPVERAYIALSRSLDFADPVLIHDLDI